MKRAYHLCGEGSEFEKPRAAVFSKQPQSDAKTRSMVPNIREFEYIVTDSEMEALLLECNLIKKHHPYYNILLKDDKSYPYIKVTVQEMFPRIFITRRMEKDKAKYYGPFYGCAGGEGNRRNPA